MLSTGPRGLQELQKRETRSGDRSNRRTTHAISLSYSAFDRPVPRRVRLPKANAQRAATKLSVLVLSSPLSGDHPPASASCFVRLAYDDSYSKEPPNAQRHLAVDSASSVQENHQYDMLAVRLFKGSHRRSTILGKLTNTPAIGGTAPRLAPGFHSLLAPPEPPLPPHAWLLRRVR